LAYRIEVNRAAQKQILALPREAQLEIAKAIDSLADVPRPPGCKKLHGTELWRLRRGHYRIVYVIDDGAKLITITKAARRREDTYKGI